MTWDGMSCWNETQAGVTADQQCPDHKSPVRDALPLICLAWHDERTVSIYYDNETMITQMKKMGRRGGDENDDDDLDLDNDDNDDDRGGVHASRQAGNIELVLSVQHFYRLIVRILKWVIDRMKVIRSEKTCQADGVWFDNMGNEWTDYRACYEHEENNSYKIVVAINSLDIIFLTLAIILFAHFKFGAEYSASSDIISKANQLRVTSICENGMRAD
ncbi:hypothetical protein HELRODRAFT_165905 [Helobdella robusta]|uniref:G-protein coupled receptors family 2 profile 1 domain-containing protein n=1 Tax=Helobdella robusta TaxID=6412 RepID=T1EXF4_HELRO|nr:hypothetical protein HELRODRAFT_165905 [Helobdella robusta]ESN91823.1 hypothetical protein HELRODRAFT_165905 [Helobdella robusta]